jgi:hypothetical protein
VFPARSPLNWQHLKRQISGARLSHLYFGFGRKSTAHRLSMVCFKDDRDDRRSDTDIDEHFQRSCTYFSTKMVVVVVDGLQCGSYSTATGHHGICPHACAEKIANGLERLVEIKA